MFSTGANEVNASSVTITWNKSEAADDITHYVVVWDDCHIPNDALGIVKYGQCSERSYSPPGCALDAASQADACAACKTAGEAVSLAAHCEDYFQYLYDITGLTHEREYRVWVLPSNGCGVAEIDDDTPVAEFSTSTCPK